MRAGLLCGGHGPHAEHGGGSEGMRSCYKGAKEAKGRHWIRDCGLTADDCGLRGHAHGMTAGF